MQVFIEKLKKLWNLWEIRGMVVVSLFLQTILIVFGSRRKNNPRIWIRILLWSAYISADWVATVSLSVLATKDGDSEDNNSSKATNELQAFWAPFLLLHLGGPDTITAYSLEDNELWLRHLLGLLVQVGVAFYVFLRSWSNNALTFLAIPVFVNGIIKYGERTWALRASSAKQIKESLLSTPDPGPDFVSIMRKGDQDKLVKYDDAAMVIPEESIKPDDDLIVQAYYLFKRFKYLFADLILGYYERNGSYSIINSKSAEEAFKLVAIELGFLYDVLYTKATIVYSALGILFRCISFFSSLSTLVVFVIIVDKQSYRTVDISITYLLLVGALALEVYSFIIHSSSHWTKIRWTQLRKVGADLNCCDTPSHSLKTDCKSWSGSIAQYNLISFCHKDKPANCVGFRKLICIHEILEKYHYKDWTDIEVDLQKSIFAQLQGKANMVKDDCFDIKLCKQILGMKGDHALERGGLLDRFRWCTVDVEFDHSLLLWHIATDLCYYDDISRRKNPNTIDSKCKVSKCLSDYMLYLLVMCPTMLPKGIGEIRYRDTCAEAMRYFSSLIPSNKTEVCKELLKIDVSIAVLEEIKGDKSQSVLFYACSLAKQLQSLESEENWGYEQKWEMISEVWVEILAYAANHCGWKEHGQQLRRGGELLTYVCLLMTHLGLSEQYQILKKSIHNPAYAPMSYYEFAGMIQRLWYLMFCCCLCGTLCCCPCCFYCIYQRRSRR